MSQYFDKDFFRFLLGFVAIIVVSCLIILLARVYESQKDVQPAPAPKTVTT